MVDVPRIKPDNRKKRAAWAGAILVGLAVVTAGLSRLNPASPTVERSTLWVDAVRRGEMVRAVRGPGSLVSEDVRLVPAMVAGRVERILVRAGEAVEPGTVILELSNPDVQLEALEAQRELAAAESDYLGLEQRLTTELLDQRAVASEARADQRDAERRAAADDALAEGDLIPRLDAARSSDAAETAAERAAVETQRYELRANGIQAQLAVQRRQVERMRAVVRFQEEQVASMRVVAGAAGTLQLEPLEVGQWVQPGDALAKVVGPGRLEAEIRIPETQAEDLAPGQSVEVDLRTAVVRGRVARVDPVALQGTVKVEISIDDSLPAGARPDQAVDGTIEIERLPGVLHVGRPAAAQPATQVSLFKLVDGGHAAVRVPVRLGRASVTTIEVLEGLAEGDEVILSDMGRWDDVDRVRIE
jgi:multidrug efflux pump subunit AcrA (membrane-fusion protein)